MKIKALYPEGSRVYLNVQWRDQREPISIRRQEGGADLELPCVYFSDSFGWDAECG